MHVLHLFEGWAISRTKVVFANNSVKYQHWVLLSFLAWVLGKYLLTKFFILSMYTNKHQYSDQLDISIEHFVSFLLYFFCLKVC